MLSEAADFKRNWQDAQKARLADGVEADSYVYVHLQEDTGEPFYVGIGHTAIRPWEMNASRNSKHKSKVKKHGVRVEILATDLTWEQACFWEILWIKALRDAGYKLTNFNNGGEGNRGYRHTDKAKKILSEKNTERLLSLGDEHPSKRPETKKKIAQSRIGMVMPVGEDSNSAKLKEFQVIDILESTASQSVMSKKHGISPATIRNIRDGDIWGHLKDRVNKPRKYDDDRTKTGESHHRFGAGHSDEAKEKLRQHNLGKKAAQQTKDKLSFVTSGEKNPRAKISEELAQSILDFSGTHAAASRYFNLPYGYVVDIRTGRCWKHLKRSEVF